MTPTDLKIGCKVTINITQEAAREHQTGKEKAKNYLSEIFDIKDDGTIVLSVPIIHTRIVVLETTLRYNFIFSTDDGFLMAQGRILNHYRKGNFFLMDATLTTPLENFQRREYFRLDCSLPAMCVGLAEENFDPMKIDDVSAFMTDNISSGFAIARGKILNISGGGALYMTDRDFKGIDYVVLRIVLHEDEEEETKESIDIIGRILEQTWNEDASNYRYRLQFMFRDPRFREKVVQYVFDEQRRQRKKEQEG